MILAILAELIVKSGNCFQRSYFIFWWILTVQLGALADQWTIVANEDSPGNNLCGLTEWQPFAKQFHTQWAGGPYWQKIMDVYFWQGTRQVNSITVVLEAYAVQAWGLLFIWAKWTPVSLCFLVQAFKFDNSSFLHASLSSRELGAMFTTFMLKNGWVKANVRQKFLSHRACIFHSSFAMSSTLCFST